MQKQEPSTQLGCEFPTTHTHKMTKLILYKSGEKKKFQCSDLEESMHRWITLETKVPVTRITYFSTSPKDKV